MRKYSDRMALDLHHMLSTSVLRPASIDSRGPLPVLIARTADGSRELDPADIGTAGTSPHGSRRTRIWEFDAGLHCSIIGTCLTTAELRHVLDKLKIGAVSSDHEVHTLGVTLAGRREAGSKSLQKALDRRHRTAITRYSKAKDPAALTALWAESLKQGDIPGAYWAVLTHPLATEEIVKQVFGDVHMLSHLVGAANRADFRRLQELERENEVLAAKVQRQQRQLHDGFSDRDRTIQHLNEMLATDERAESSAAAAPGTTEKRQTVRSATSTARSLVRSHGASGVKRAQANLPRR